jgi:hypothetical protein
MHGHHASCRSLWFVATGGARKAHARRAIHCENRDRDLTEVIEMEDDAGNGSVKKGEMSELM